MKETFVDGIMIELDIDTANDIFFAESDLMF